MGHSERKRKMEFFHKAWMLLKAENPRLQKRMTELEIRLAGTSPPYPKALLTTGRPLSTNQANEPEKDDIQIV